jgi:hypothetical protein
MKKTRVKWFDQPAKHDYSAAETYLSLTMKPRAAKAIASELKDASMMEFAAKDIFRASELPLLTASNSHVRTVTADIVRGVKMSPLLLYRGSRNGKLIIADGYHRLCGVYTFDEDIVVPCKIV